MRVVFTLPGQDGVSVMQTLLCTGGINNLTGGVTNQVSAGKGGTAESHQAKERRATQQESAEVRGRAASR